MTVQKFITYTPLDINGKQLDSSQELKLNILEASGNYVLHRDLLRHFNSQLESNCFPFISNGAYVINF